MTTPLQQVLALLKLFPSKVASKQGSAVTINAISEVLACDADFLALPVLQLTVFDVVPLLHAFLG